MNLVILGGPRTGKTYLSNKISNQLNPRQILHTDKLMHLPWSEASEAASYWFDTPGEWIIEGVMAVRALRKWLERNKGKKPDWEIVFLTKLKSPYSARGQESMAKGVKTVFDEIYPELQSRGFKILYQFPGESK